MTFQPILERELRVRARSRGAYWSRFAVALAAILLCLPQMFSSYSFAGVTALGQVLLSIIVSAAFLLCCAACLLTSDLISAERRQGTLGFLLLTRVSVFDVLVGKLGSAGLTSLCGLIAFLPMLMITVLAGGVTGGEAFRKELVLLDTLFVALAAGLWGSAGGRESVKTGREALLALAAVVVGPLAANWLFKSGGGVFTHLTLLSPLGTMSAAADMPYKLSAADYWISLLLVQAAGWALLIAAGFRLRRGWQEEQRDPNLPAPAPELPPEAEAVPPARQPLDDDMDPITWRLRRQRRLRDILWVAAFVYSANYWIVPLLVLVTYLRSMAFWPLISPIMLALAIVEGALFAWAASRFFVQARRTGELELFLSTPVGVRQIVAAQWEVLKRALRGPLVLMLAAAFCQAAITLVQIRKTLAIPGVTTDPEWEFWVTQAFSCLDTVLAVGALCWAGLWFGLRAAGQARAITWTVAIVTGVPMLLGILKWMVVAPLLRGVFGHNWLGYCVWTGLPQSLGLLYYIAIIYFARRSLLRRLAPGESMAFDLRQSTASVAQDALSAIRKARHWTPS